MKKFYHIYLCGLLAVTLAVTLAACQSSSIKEKPMAVQDVPVNVLSEVEQEQDVNYPYTDETELCMGIPREYKKYKDEATENVDTLNEFYRDSQERNHFCNWNWQGYPLWIYLKAPDQFNEYAVWLESPSDACLSAQDAANCAGRLAGLYYPENKDEIHQTCVKETSVNGEQYYWLLYIDPWYEKNISQENRDYLGEGNHLARQEIAIDGVTAELYFYKNNEEIWKEHSLMDYQTIQDLTNERNVETELQKILDALGNGQKCTQLTRIESGSKEGVTQYLEYHADVNGKNYRVLYYVDTEQIASVKQIVDSGIGEWTEDMELVSPLQGGLYTSRVVSQYHCGTDYTAERGSPVFAAADGVVSIAVKEHNSYGNYVEIQHENGRIVSLYAHLMDFCVEEGQTVSAGQKIGSVGNSGEATGNMLHFELCVDEQMIDPTTINFVHFWKDK